MWVVSSHTKMSDSDDSDFSDNQSERSSDGEAEEVDENEVSWCWWDATGTFLPVDL